MICSKEPQLISFSKVEHLCNLRETAKFNLTTEERSQSQSSNKAVPVTPLTPTFPFELILVFVAGQVDHKENIRLQLETFSHGGNPFEQVLQEEFMASPVPMNRWGMESSNRIPSI